MKSLTNRLVMIRTNQETPIRSFEELVLARQNLKDEIMAQEADILNSPFVTIPSAIIQGGTFKSSLKNSLGTISIDDYKHAVMNLIGTALLANRRTRKFYIGFVIAKELVPFFIEKFNELVKKNS